MTDLEINSVLVNSILTPAKVSDEHIRAMVDELMRRYDAMTDEENAKNHAELAELAPLPDEKAQP